MLQDGEYCVRYIIFCFRGVAKTRLQDAYSMGRPFWTHSHRRGSHFPRVYHVMSSSTRIQSSLTTIYTIMQSAIGNWIADIMHRAYDDVLVSQLGVGPADGALITGGTLRGDSIYGPGTISLNDIMEILPWSNPVIVVEMDGACLWSALEAGLGMWPAHEGYVFRFYSLHMVGLSDRYTYLIMSLLEYRLQTLSHHRGVPRRMGLSPTRRSSCYRHLASQR